ncbi:asparagine synthase (glutamine-hydrolyzing) [soil metagenome]
MCGISGLISRKNNPINRELIIKMNDTIRHRGPDDEGFYFGENFGLGHQRLSILDLSSDGHQPMHYLEKYVIIFNGEIYNYLEIKEELVKLGYQFNSKTDTEVILAAYTEWGESCVEKFNGMWAFLILDKVKRIFFCSRDRFGIKPFYFTILGDFFAFGSEIKLFTALPDWNPGMNLARALDFLMYGIFDHTDETLFKNVFQLKGGHNLIYNLEDHNYEIIQWYNIKSKIKKFRGDFEEAKLRLVNLFQESVKLRLRSDVKVGSCLSGGLDSSAIVCTVNQILKETGKADLQETVSSCFENKQFDEQDYIDSVIEKTTIKAHKVFPQYEELFKSLDQIIWHQDSPIGSSSIFAQYNVFRTSAQNKITVMLDGQGADETLAGYDGFFYSYYSSLLFNLNFSQLAREISSVKKFNRFNLHNFLVETIYKILPVFLYRHFKVKQSNLLKRGIKPKIINSLRNQEDFLFNQSLQISDLQQLSFNQLLDHSLPMLLHNADRMSMAHSIESRLPFLDYRLVEFILALPDNFKIKEGKTKYIFRESFSEILPKKIIHRYDKMGFITPETYWMKKFKKEFYEKLDEATDILEKIADKKIVLSNFKNEVEHDIPLGSYFWRYITLARWIKIFKVNIEL